MPKVVKDEYSNLSFSIGKMAIRSYSKHFLLLSLPGIRSNRKKERERKNKCLTWPYRGYIAYVISTILGTLIGYSWKKLEKQIAKSHAEQFHAHN